jgi:hypothetical protein
MTSVATVRDACAREFQSGRKTGRSLKGLLLLAALLMPISTFAQSAQKFFGYFGGDYASVSPHTPDLPEFQDHINLYSIMDWSGTSDNVAWSEDWVLTQLDNARHAHVHAIVPAFPFVFQHASGEVGFRYDTGAAAKWNSLVQKMLDRGFLIPGDPERSIVSAIYLVDEPNGDGKLRDQNGQAHPALANAVAAIRGNSATASVPIASILTPDFDSIREGIKLIDWVGFDDYGISDKNWTITLNGLESNYAPGKKYIIVPGAVNNCMGVTLESPSRYTARMDSDPNIVWLAPFMWLTRGSCLGARDLPAIRGAYKIEGTKIRNSTCNASPTSQWFCSRSSDISGVLNMLLDD